MAFSAEAQAVRSRSVGAAGIAVFAVALFVSAFLLFAIQPIVTKLLLPRFGGAPAVWSVAMVFFQGLVLAGYTYAHVLVRYFSVRAASVIHLTLLFLTTLVLPIGIAEGWGRPPAEGEPLWLMGLLAVSVGLPFFAVSGTGPLLQAWFFRSGHRHAEDPYFLYGASNLGSFAALLLYPILLEPLMSLVDQRIGWSAGFIFLVVLIGSAAMLVLAPAEDHDAASPARSAPLSWVARLQWLGLSFVPSALLVAVTAHISTDVASAPLLWVIPLALYLLTFIIAFQRRPLIPHRAMLAVLPFAVAGLILLLALGWRGWIGFIFVHLGVFFVATLACHGEMVRLRPRADRLTEFYFWMSAGGVAGGIFAGLLAPQMFSSVVEYPVLAIASLFALPQLRTMGPLTLVRQAMVASAIVLVLLVPAFLGWRPELVVYVGILFVAGLFFITLRERPALFAGVMAGLLVMGSMYQGRFQNTESYRSFFGVNRIAESADGRFRVLMHGTTIHGAERIRNDDGTPYVGIPQPATYYAPQGTFGDGIASVRAEQGSLANVAIVGLGSGSLACWAAPGEKWSFYEIDPTVIAIATDPKKFDFLSACAPDARMVVGDARLTLGDAPDGSFNLIVLDAFSSDSVPTHLLTREAYAGYLRKLAPGGVILSHISNRSMDLAPVVAASAEGNGLVSYHRFSPNTEEGARDMIFGSEMVAIARTTADLGQIATSGRWRPLAADPSFREWTDDYSNLLESILRGLSRSR